MPIYINNKKLENLNIGNSNINKAYVGNVLVYQKINLDVLDVQTEQYYPFDFIINTNLGTGSSFDLPLRSGYNYNFVVDWGDGAINTITSYDDADKLHTYSAHGIYRIKITGLCEAWYFNNTGDKNKLIRIDDFGDVGFINMDYAFRGCTNLTSLGVIYPKWCKDVVSMNLMFRDCVNIERLDISSWDVSNVTSMIGMFYNCIKLNYIDIKYWDVINLTSTVIMFDGCSSLEKIDLDIWNSINLLSTQQMFSNCVLLNEININNMNVSNVTNMSYMFSNCNSLISIDLNNWNVEKVTDFTRMFSTCNSLVELHINNWRTNSAINMFQMFFGCRFSHIDISDWNVSTVNNMGMMFTGCNYLTNINIGNWDISNVINMTDMFVDITLDTTSYDNLLVGWSTLSADETQIPINIEFNCGYSKYTTIGEAAKNILETTYGWNINDGGLDI